MGTEKTGQQVNVGFKIPLEEYQLWKVLAAQEQRSIANMIRVAVSDKVKATVNLEVKAEALEEL